MWGIWLGHVYHWHIVTAAMQMTMFENLPDGHRLYPLLQPQSQSLIDFDFVLLTFLWGQIAPPTPVADYMARSGSSTRSRKDGTSSTTTLWPSWRSAGSMSTTSRS